jgi:hypothetical protein
MENKSLDGLMELRNLIMSENENITFADNAFGTYALENLDTLDLSYCEMSTLPDDLLQALPYVSNYRVRQFFCPP